MIQKRSLRFLHNMYYLAQLKILKSRSNLANRIRETKNVQKHVFPIFQPPSLLPLFPSSSRRLNPKSIRFDPLVSRFEVEKGKKNDIDCPVNRRNSPRQRGTRERLLMKAKTKKRTLLMAAAINAAVAWLNDVEGKVFSSSRRVFS